MNNDKECLEYLIGASMKILKTRQRTLAVPGEAIFGIEAIALNTACPGRTFLNLDSGPYGRQFGLLLERLGATVENVSCGWNETLDPAAVEEAALRVRPDVIAYVHTEAVTGGKNPAEKIQEIAKRVGAATILDCVSSIGADEVDMDGWGADFVSIGMQKALGGPRGVSFLGISERGWALIESSSAKTPLSVLSLPELYRQEKEGVPEHMPLLEMRAAEEAFLRIEKEGFENLIKRHQRTAEAFRKAALSLGYSLWQKDPAGLTSLNTTIVRPATEASLRFRGSGIVREGNGELKEKLLRINHYGENASGSVPEDAAAVLARLAPQGPAA